MFLDLTTSRVFGSGNAVMENTLKNPNQFREAVLFEHISNLPPEKIKEFIHSDEAKTMVDNGMLSCDSIERLAHHADKHHHHFHSAVCHMAKENEDPLWDELVKCRIEERRIMNEIIDKYGKKAEESPAVKNTISEFINKCIPEYFRT